MGQSSGRDEIYTITRFDHSLAKNSTHPYEASVIGCSAQEARPFSHITINRAEAVTRPVEPRLVTDSLGGHTRPQRDGEPSPNKDGPASVRV